MKKFYALLVVCVLLTVGLIRVSYKDGKDIRYLKSENDSVIGVLRNVIYNQVLTGKLFDEMGPKIKIHGDCIDNINSRLSKKGI